MYGKILKNYFENNEYHSDICFGLKDILNFSKFTEKEDVLEVRFDAKNAIEKYPTSSKYKNFRYESELACGHVAKALNKALNKKKFKYEPIIKTEYYGPHDFGACEEKILIGCKIIYSD